MRHVTRDSFSANGELNGMKKARVFKAEFKAAAVKRMQQGENASALARELKVRRKLLYEWRDAVLAGRPLRLRGRPRNSLETDPPGREPAERVGDLERLVGQLTAENRFFKGALQRIKELRRQSKKAGAAASMRRSKQ
jgi:transposase-like protein